MPPLIDRVQPPPFRVPLLDASGQLVETWRRFFLTSQVALTQILAAKPSSLAGTQQISIDDSNSFDDVFPPLTGGFSGVATFSGVIDDNTTNATMYPVWVSATPGNEQLETSSTELTWNPGLAAFGFSNTPADNQFRVRIKGSLSSGASALSLQVDKGANAATFTRVWSMLSEDASVQYASFSVSSTIARFNSNGTGGAPIGLDLHTNQVAPITLSTAGTVWWTLSGAGGFSNTGSDPGVNNVAIAGTLAVTGLISGTLASGAQPNITNIPFLNVANIFTAAQFMLLAGIVAVSTDGAILENTTAATAGVPVQISPRLRFRSNVWNTTTPANNTNDWWIESVPVSAATPKGVLQVLSSLNGAASTTPLLISSAGYISTIAGYGFGGNAPASQGIQTSGTSLLINSGGAAAIIGLNDNGGNSAVVRFGASLSKFFSPADAQLNLTNTGVTAGVGFDVSTDAVLKIRTRAQTGDASLSALSVTTSGTLIDKSYNIAVPVTLGTVTMSANQQRQIINPAGTLAVLTVTLPPTPTDGQIAGISFAQAITGLTINAPGGATVVGPPVSAAINSEFQFLYQASSTSWFPAA